MAQQVEVPGVGMLEFPDDMPQQAIAAAIQKNFPQIHKPQEAKAEPIGMGGRILRGMRDPIDGLAQLASHSLSDTAVGRGINSLGNALGMAPGDPASMDANLAQREQEYQASRRAAMPQSMSGLVTGKKEEPGFDAMRLLGNVATSAIPASRIVQAATLPGRIATGVASGAAFGAANPVTQGDYWTEKGKQTAIGAATGGLLPAVTSGLARVISPQTSQQVKTLLDQGITPTPGQVLGGAFKAAEEKLSSVPLLGAAIRNGQNRASEQLNTVAINRSLTPVGAALPKGVKGREAIEFAERTLGDKYDDVLGRMGALKVDAKLVGDMQGLNRILANQPKEIAEQFDRIIQNEVRARANAQGFMTSEALKAAESNLGKTAKGYRSSQDYDKRVLGEAIDEAQNALREWVTRRAPAGVADDLKKVNEGWANFKRVQSAAGRVGSEEGTFSAAQLQGAVRAADRSKDKAAFARGGALMQDLSEPAKTVLGSRVPNSGTADRSLAAMMIGAPLAGGAAMPAIALGALPAVAYTRAGQNTLATLLARRPEGAQPLSNLVRRVGQTSSPLLAPALYSAPPQGRQ